MNNYQDTSENIDNAKVNRLINELLPVAMKKAIDNDNIYDVAAVFLAYGNILGRSNTEVLEYDTDGYPSKLRLVGITLPEAINKLEADGEAKNLLNNRFSNLKKINALKGDDLTLKEAGQLYYIFGKLMLKYNPIFDVSRYPSCDNI
jgi:hypothetical protein